MRGLHKKVTTDRINIHYGLRRKLLLTVMLLAMLGLIWRAVYLQVLDKQFLKEQGKSRYVATVDIPAYRGKILDRQGKPLAISTPVMSIWLNPQQFKKVRQRKKALHEIAQLLELPESRLWKRVDASSEKRFVSINKQVDPQLADYISALQIDGIHMDKAFKRYYPTGEVSAHLLGFTNVDDKGQEGLELYYENYLHGVPGRKRVIRDGKKRIIADVEAVAESVPGRDLQLSIDQRIQYLAYRELKTAVQLHKAHSASVVVLDATNGEVLAMVNQPSFNPNARKNRRAERYRNRAITDVFEPGSTVKPFVIACALEAGFIKPDFKLDTSPGWYRIGRNRVQDIHNYGKMDLTRILQKSSNVAVSRIALMMPPETFWQCYDRLGFGHLTGVGFPGEADGRLLDFHRWHPFEQATLSFGYGVSASLLQLARAYTVLADEGLLHSISLLKREQDDNAYRIISAGHALKVRKMLESVVDKRGTAYRARVPGYRVAGKTGTVKKAGIGGYSKNRYVAVFVGMAPASAPKLIVAVMVDEPGTKHYYGGVVAGPVFAKIMQGALRILNIAPDQQETMPVLLSQSSD